MFNEDYEEEELKQLKKDNENRGGDLLALRRIKKLELKFEKLGGIVYEMFKKYDSNIWDMS